MKQSIKHCLWQTAHYVYYGIIVLGFFTVIGTIIEIIWFSAKRYYTRSNKLKFKYRTPHRIVYN